VKVAEIKWLGHAAFEIEIANKILLIDPWLDENPKACKKVEDLKKVDIVCVTHDHGDHLGDAIKICKQTEATFVGIFELGVYAEEQGVKDVVGINIGGAAEVKGVNIAMVPAFHSALRGAPVGFIINAEGKTVYHSGDTSLFGDMRLIGEIYRPNVVLIPIGGYYTMGPNEAARAVEFIKPDVVIPMHYQTFPVLASSAEEFGRAVKKRTPAVIVAVLKPGESYKF
jgi:L-ascorbate metabolism protein UlaG (beta-lactamase superfamily)